jgi:riboflavin kinase/FMN adenylyltransferase
VTQPPKDVIERMAAVSDVPHAVTIGNFDGVHRGHQYLIQRVVERARRDGTRSLVVTFEPHPTSVLRPDHPFQRLTSEDDKRRLLCATGVDDLLVIPFSREFASLEPDEFLTHLAQHVHPTSIYVGEGFRFGRGRSGDGTTIRAFGELHGFDTVILPRLRDGEREISSSAVRTALQSGDVTTAAHALGRRYRLRGVVEHGAARGRELGYPTANLLVQDDLLIPMDGIYAAYAHVEQRHLGPRQSMVYIGSRPMFDGGGTHVEVNILDFAGDLYTLDIEIEFVEFMRGDAVFDSIDDLVRQIALDEERTRASLARNHPESDAIEQGA